MSESIAKDETINRDICSIEAKHPKLKEFILKVDERKSEITEEICTLIAHLSRKQREYLVLLDNIYADVLIKYERLDAKLHTLVKTKLSLESALRANDHSTLLNDTSAPLEAEIERIKNEQKFLPIDFNLKWQTEQFDKLMSNLLGISVINGQKESLDRSTIDVKTDSNFNLESSYYFQKKRTKLKNNKKSELSESLFYIQSNSKSEISDENADFNNSLSVDIQRKQVSLDDEANSKGLIENREFNISSRYATLPKLLRVKPPLIETQISKETPTSIEEIKYLKLDLVKANEKLELYRERLRSHLVAAKNYPEEKLIRINDDQVLIGIFFDHLTTD